MEDWKKLEALEAQNKKLWAACFIMVVVIIVALVFTAIITADSATQTAPEEASLVPPAATILPPVQQEEDFSPVGMYEIEEFYRWPALCVGPGLHYDERWGDCLSDRPVSQLIAEGTIQTPQQYLESNPELKDWMLKTCQSLEAKGDGSVYDYKVGQLGELPKYLPPDINCGMVDQKWQAEEVECDVSPIIANGADQALKPLTDGSGRNGHWVLVKRPVPIDNFAAGWNKPAAQIRELNPGISDPIHGCTAVLIQIY